MKKRKAFTLTELLVVMGIAVLVMSMGAVAFKDALKNRRLKGAARSIHGALLQTRVLAISMGAIYYGRINPATGTYGAYWAPDGNVGSGELVAKEVFLPDVVKFEVPGGTGDILFLPDGTIDWTWTGDKTWAETQAGDGDIEIKETGVGGKTMCFDLNPNTGSVRFTLL